MKVWVTRDECPDGPLSTALRASGLSPILEPVITRQVRGDCAEELSRLDADDWLVLTSPFAIEAVAGGPARIPRVAVVGEASRRAAASGGFRVEWVGAGHTAAALFRELRRRVTRGTVCYPRSSRAEAPVAWSDVTIVSPILYDTRPREFDRGVVRRVDVVTFASASAVESVYAATSLRDVPCCVASIGPKTADALRRAGVAPDVQAATPTFESLADAIAGFAGRAT